MHYLTFDQSYSRLPFKQNGNFLKTISYITWMFCDRLNPNDVVFCNWQSRRLYERVLQVEVSTTLERDLFYWNCKKIVKIGAVSCLSMVKTEICSIVRKCLSPKVELVNIPYEGMLITPRMCRKASSYNELLILLF